MEGIVSRLSAVPDIRLPGQLTRNGPASRESVQLYMRSLLERDPGVFLERYGDALESRELVEFESLRDDYEVDFHLKVLESKRDPRVRQTTAKNRRLAYMHKLMSEGTYFSETAMEQRQPWLFHHLVGQYRPTPAAERPIAYLSSREYAEQLLAREDAAQLQEARLDQQAAYDAVENETSSDDDADDSSVGCAVQRTGARADSRSQSPLDQADAPLDENPRAREQAFLEAMQQRFLAGDDPGVNYAEIDRDAELDQHWAAEQSRDAEEHYFEA